MHEDHAEILSCRPNTVTIHYIQLSGNYLNLFLHRDNSDGNFRTVMAALVQLEY